MEKQVSTISADEVAGLMEKIMGEQVDITIPVTGNSMSPLWRHGRDSVTLTRCDNTGLKKGDIPLYRRLNGQYVMHRIVKVTPDGYDLCGDAQTVVERCLPHDCVIAVVRSFTRNGRVYHCDQLTVRLYSALWPVLRLIRRFTALPGRALRKLKRMFQ